MNELLAKIIDAHQVNSTIVSGGGLFPLKGVPQDSNPRRMTVWLHEERSSVLPYGAPYQRTMFTSDRIAIEKLNCTLATERYAPRDSFAGHQIGRSFKDAKISRRGASVAFATTVSASA